MRPRVPVQQQKVRHRAWTAVAAERAVEGGALASGIKPARPARPTTAPNAKKVTTGSAERMT